MARSLKCYHCKIEFSVPDYWYQTRIMDCVTFWCPNGHEQHFVRGESEAEKLRRERDSLKQQIARVEQEKRDAVAAAEERAATAERVTKRLKRRAAAGTCPCCKRTFSNMSTHMRKQHPEFVKPQLVCEKTS